MRLGEYLCQHDLLDATRLEEALSHQSVYGDRLGTNLVELQVLSVEKLAECLSDFHKVPLPPRKWLERPKKAAIKRVTRPMVERLRFLPMRIEGNVLHAAVLDPRDPGLLDDLRFATGCRIEPYVLPEIWMHDWLLSLFKIPRGIRHVETDTVERATQSDSSAGFDFQAANAQRSAQDSRGAPAPTDRTSSMAAEPATGVPTGVPAPHEVSTAPSAGWSHGAEPITAENPAPMGSANSSHGIPAPPMGHPQMPVADAHATLDNLPPVAPPPVPEQAKAASASTAGPAVPHVPGASVRPPQITVQSLADLAIGSGPSSLSGIADGHTETSAPSLWDAPTAPSTDWMDELTSKRSAAYDMEPPAVARAHGTAPLGQALPSIPDAPLPAVPNAPVGAPMPSIPDNEGNRGSGDGVADADGLAQDEGLLQQSGNRSELIDAALKVGTRFARRVGLFIVQQGMLQGARCAERGETRALDGILVSLDTPCMLTRVVTAGEPLREGPFETHLDRRVLQFMSDDDAVEVALFPIRIQGRVVNVLYASNGEQPLGPVAYGALLSLADEMGACYERIILARKRA